MFIHAKLKRTKVWQGRLFLRELSGNGAPRYSLHSGTETGTGRTGRRRVEQGLSIIIISFLSFSNRTHSTFYRNRTTLY